MEGQLFAGYDPSFEGDEPPGLLVLFLLRSFPPVWITKPFAILRDYLFVI